MNIFINKELCKCNDETIIEMCKDLKKRIIKILYLKDDIVSKKISVDDFNGYIDTLTCDIYGYYIVFNNRYFLNTICELEGLRSNIFENYARKKALDLANFVENIPTKI